MKVDTDALRAADTAMLWRTVEGVGRRETLLLGVETYLVHAGVRGALWALWAAVRRRL